MCIIYFLCIPIWIIGWAIYFHIKCVYEFVHHLCSLIIVYLCGHLLKSISLAVRYSAFDGKPINSHAQALYVFFL